MQENEENDKPQSAFWRFVESLQDSSVMRFLTNNPRHMQALQRERDKLNRKATLTEAELDRIRDKFYSFVRQVNEHEKAITFSNEQIAAAQEVITALEGDRNRKKSAINARRMDGDDKFLTAVTLGLYYLFSDKITKKEADTLILRAEIEHAVAAGPHNRKINESKKTIEGSQKDLVRINKKSAPVGEKKTRFESILTNLREGITMNERAINISEELEKSASRHHTTVDKVLKRAGNVMSNIANNKMGLEDIEALLKWANKYKGKFDLSAEELTVKEFINHTLVPHLDYFVINAMHGIDPKTVKPTDYPHIQKASGTGLPLNEGVRSVLNLGERVNNEDAVKAAQEKAPKMAINAILNRPGQIPHMERLRQAINSVNGQMMAYTAMFRGVEKEIDDLIEQAHKEAQGLETVRKEEQENRSENSKIDRQLTAAQGELTHAIAYNEDRDKPGFWNYVGYGTTKLLEIIPGIGPPIAESLEDHGVGTKVANQRITRSLIQQDIHEKKGLLRYLENQKVDTKKYERQIVAIQAKIDQLTTTEAFQKEFLTAAKREAILEAYITHFVLIAGLNNSQEIDVYCQQQPQVRNIDNFLAAFNKPGEPSARLGEALTNFCYGYANSNDIAVILAEANALKTGTGLKPHEEVLKEFVEHTLKPNIASYYSRASKVDLVYQANLIGLGTKLHVEREMVRAATDKAIRSLFKSEFDMSMAGREDMKHQFDYWMHRHGDREMNDTRVAESKEHTRFVPKRIEVLPDDKEKAFVSRVKHLQSIGSEKQPELSDMFLKLCAFEYFYPQDVKIGGKENFFHAHPEAPAAYPMINQVVSAFIEKLSMTSIQDYREKVGERLDNIIAGTFFDFFNELGRQHREHEAISAQRLRVNSSFRANEVYPPAFDSYVRMITKDASEQLGLFLSLYEKNLAKQLETATEKDAKMLREQIKVVEKIADGKLAPKVIDPGSHEARLQARYENHTFENMNRSGRLE